MLLQDNAFTQAHLTHKFTRVLRVLATIFWSLGLASVAFDRIYLFQALSEGVKVAYLLFFISAMLCWWAEVREYGMRVSLYRVHDISVSSPWKYVLLYFLWVNLFAPFTEKPVHSVAYACAGWFSLVAVAFSAQLIFCERNARGIALIPSRLKVAFLTYNLSLILLSYSFIIAKLWPGWGISPLFQDGTDAALYFVMGIPFLVWDFVNPKRHLLPRPLAAMALMGVVAVFFLLRAKLFLFISILSPISLLILGVYKRIRLQRAIIYLLALCLLGINVVFIYSQVPEGNRAKEIIRSNWQYRQAIVVAKLQKFSPDLKETILALKESKFLGKGVGSSSIVRGVWLQILYEVGIIGFLLYAAFFVSLLKQLYIIRRSNQIVVSNIAFLSVLFFIIFCSFYPRNPYSTGIWVWYALWAAFSSTRLKRDIPMLTIKKAINARPKKLRMVAP